MAHADAIAERLPELYRDGALVRGVTGAPALQIEILDEIRLAVQRAHWFDTTLELAEAARLAAVLDFTPAPWQDLALFRVWVRDLRTAMVADGAVTRRALETFIAAYTDDFERARGVQAVAPLDSWGDRPSSTTPAFVENPRRPASATPSAGEGVGMEPLAQFTLTVKGLDPAEAGFLLVGLPDAPECVPVIVNVTTGQALVFLGTVATGQRLFLRPDGHGGGTARLEGTDVTSQLVSVSGVVPGSPWPRTSVESPPRALRLERGDNAMWFLPLAHYDVRGLDRFLLALPDLTLTDGRFDRAAFDQALFYEAAAVVLRVVWRESQPASFEVHLPAGMLRAPAKQLDAALHARAQLGDSLEGAVRTLRAAGVESLVRLRVFGDVQPSRERLTGVLPLRVRGRGPTGADRLPDKGGLFEVTQFEDSTFR